MLGTLGGGSHLAILVMWAMRNGCLWNPTLFCDERMPSYGNARSGLFRVVARGLVHAEAKHSFVLLPRSRVVERGLAFGSCAILPLGPRLRAPGKNLGRFSVLSLCLSHAREPLPPSGWRVKTHSRVQLLLLLIFGV